MLSFHTGGRWFPFHADINLGHEEPLSLEYRPLRWGFWDRVHLVVGSRLEALGLHAAAVIAMVGEGEDPAKGLLLSSTDRRELTSVIQTINGAFIAEIVGSWSFTDKRGQPIPITPELCGKLPPELMRAIIEVAKQATLIPGADPDEEQDDDDVFISHI